MHIIIFSQYKLNNSYFQTSKSIYGCLICQFYFFSFVWKKLGAAWLLHSRLGLACRIQRSCDLNS
jgi:hypothetical protein